MGDAKFARTTHDKLPVERVQRHFTGNVARVVGGKGGEVCREVGEGKK